MGLFNLFSSNSNTQVDFNSLEYLQEESSRRLDPYATIGSPENILNFPQESKRYAAMREDYLKLEKLFKSDVEKLKLVMKDWTDYCDCLQEIVYSHKMLSVAGSDEIKGLESEQDQAYISSQEIEKRIVDLLGNESEISRIINS